MPFNLHLTVFMTPSFPELNPAGNGLTFSTPYGGNGVDQAFELIAVDTNANMFVGGQTNSLDLALQNPLQSSNLGGTTGWVARFGVAAPPSQVPSTVSVTPSSGSGNTVTFTAVYSHPAGAAALTGAAILVNSTVSTSFACYVTYNPGLNQFALADDNGTTFGGVNSQCTLNGAVSTAVFSGTTLTLTISLIFQSPFAGSEDRSISYARPMRM